MINEINHIVVSDPIYENDVRCRYENKNINAKNWIVDLELKQTDEIEIRILLKEQDAICQFQGNEVSYLKGIKLKEYEIGMDTACIALGINDKADEIVKTRNEFKPKCALHTATDGFFGRVVEGRKDNKLVFLMIFGYLDKDLEYDVNNILDYLQEKFEIENLQLEKNKEFTNEK